jgi:hypothetical protein
MHLVPLEVGDTLWTPTQDFWRDRRYGIVQHVTTNEWGERDVIVVYYSEKAGGVVSVPLVEFCCGQPAFLDYRPISWDGRWPVQRARWGSLAPSSSMGMASTLKGHLPVYRNISKSAMP